jgi:hypothetical protein
VVRFAAMSSMKNTIVLGCFILAGFAMHAYLNRYEGDYDESDGVLFKRFNKITGQFEVYVGRGGWDRMTGGD